MSDLLEANLMLRLIMKFRKGFKCLLFLLYFSNFLSAAYAAIEFEWDDIENKKGLRVTITTERLILKSVVEEDIPNLVRLFSDPDVMKRYAAGTPRDEQTTVRRVRDVWIPRWQDNDPRGAFAVFLKDDPRTMIGSVVLGVGDGPGRAELAGLSFKDFWGKGFGSEAITALVNEYAPTLIDYQYDFAKGFKDCSFMVLSRIDATASPDNIASWKILDKLGFSCARPELQVIDEDSLTPESGPYNIRIIEKILDPVSGEEKELELVRTAEKKFSMIKWHFMKPMVCKFTRSSEANQEEFNQDR